MGMKAAQASQETTLLELEKVGLRTRSPVMKKVLEDVAFASATPLAVLLYREAGRPSQ